MMLKVNKNVVLKIIYEKEEWNKLEEIYKSIGLVKAKSVKGFEFYRTVNDLFLNFLRDALGDYSSIVMDDINEQIFYSGCYNICILRIVPNLVGDKFETSVVIDKYVTIKELREYINIIKKVLEALLSICIDAEIEFKIVGDAKNDN
ncbi:MAG: hypothetical protein QXI58_08395 [Candidatus Micrarchaeia archaeon]